MFHATQTQLDCVCAGEAGIRRDRGWRGPAYTLLTLNGVFFVHFGALWRTSEQWQLTASKTMQTFVFQWFAVAEGVGFEPTGPCGPPVFKTGAIDHSTTPPGNPRIGGGYASRMSDIQS